MHALNATGRHWTLRSNEGTGPQRKTPNCSKPMHGSEASGDRSDKSFNAAVSAAATGLEDPMFLRGMRAETWLS